MHWTFFSAIRLRYSWLVIACLALAGGVLGFIYQAGKSLPAAVVSHDIADQVIVIDAGHGGFDPGAVGVNGVLEKDVALAIAKQVAALLEMSGAEVIVTRDSDKALADNKRDDIHKRAEIAQNSKASIFLTIQANSIPNPKWHGAQVFYHPDSQEGFRLADNVQREMIRVLQNTDRVALPIKTVYLLNHLEIPAVVVEVGFLSNPEEEQALTEEDYQNRMAWSIYNGIVNYFAGDPAISQPVPAK